jgi:hypothetical protein
MWRSLLLVMPIAAAALLAAGCAGGSRVGATDASRSLARAVPPHVGPYAAALAFAACLRAHGVPHPDPDGRGDFHLTPSDEARLRKVGSKKHEAAEKACFHLLKGTVSLKPLSREARRAALEPLRDLKRCLEARGFKVGKPLVRNMSRGRAMFGFDEARPPPASARARTRLRAAQHACEKQTSFAARIDAIVKADRGEDR